MMEYNHFGEFMESHSKATEARSGDWPTLKIWRTIQEDTVSKQVLFEVITFWVIFMDNFLECMTLLAMLR